MLVRVVGLSILTVVSVSHLPLPTPPPILLSVFRSVRLAIITKLQITVFSATLVIYLIHTGFLRPSTPVSIAIMNAWVVTEQPIGTVLLAETTILIRPVLSLALICTIVIRRTDVNLAIPSVLIHVADL